MCYTDKGRGKCPKYEVGYSTVNSTGFVDLVVFFKNWTRYKTILLSVVIDPKKSHVTWKYYYLSGSVSVQHMSPSFEELASLPSQWQYQFATSEPKFQSSVRNYSYRVRTQFVVRLCANDAKWDTFKKKQNGRLYQLSEIQVQIKNFANFVRNPKDFI